MTASSRKSGCGWLLGLFFLGICAAGGSYFYFKYLRGQELTPLVAAEVLPEDTMTASFISTDAKNWSQLTKFQGLPIEKWTNQLDSSLMKDNNLNFTQDIQPWLGNAMVALIPSEQSSGDPELLIVLGIKDKLKAKQFFDKLTEKLAQKPKETQYQGISLWQMTTDQGATFNYALLDGRLVGASQQKALEQAIDSYKGQPSLADNSQHQALFTDPLTLKNPVAQFYLLDYGRFMTEMLKNNELELPAATLQQFQKVKSVVMGLGIEQEGLHLQAIAKIDPTLYGNSPKNTHRLLEKTPANTLMMLNGAGISQIWNESIEQVEQEPNLKANLGEIRQALRDNTGLDLDRDVLGWMDGEFVLGMLPSASGALADFGIGGLILLETGDRPRAEATIQRFEELAKSNLPPGIQPQMTDIQGKTMTQWQAIPGKTAIAYGWLDKNLLLLTIGMTPDPVITTQSGSSLAQSPSFKDFTASLPTQNANYFYLNFEEGLSTLKKLPGAEDNLPIEAQQTLSAFRGIALTATRPNEQTSQMDVMLVLKTQEKAQ